MVFLFSEILGIFFLMTGDCMEQIKEINVTLDVLLSVPARSNSEAYDKLDRMDILKLLQLAVEQCEFSESECAAKH
jgi:hypothetical protein